MKKIKLPLEMANGVMVGTLDELKENWDLEKVVGYFGDGRLVTWLNDRYYTDLAEQVQKITAKGAEAQKQLCAVFGMEFKQDEVVDAEALAERKHKLDILRQYTSDDEILKNVDSVAFNQEDLADLLDEGVEKIYLCNGKFSVPLNISGKKYIGITDAEVYIGKDELQDFDKLRISFENVKFDEKYQKLVEEKEEIERKKKQEEIEREKALNAKKPGQIIKLGNYQGEDIEWIILEVDGGKAKLLSRYVLEMLPFDDNSDTVDWKSTITWENCSLRRWLNSSFYKDVFSDQEKYVICDSDVISDCSIYNGCNAAMSIVCHTNDKVFIMDSNDLIKLCDNEHYNSDFANVVNEFKNYNNGTTKYYCFNKSTEFVCNKSVRLGLYITKEDDIKCWLRDTYGRPGWSSSYMSEPFYYHKRGQYKFGYLTGDQHYSRTVGVRPVMWIDLSKV